uniref:LPXTG cell wall anchor domain-containing protein n=1 Tax=Faecalibacterium sp. TaxID=1971605 RepID=UPI004027E634
PVTPDAPVQDSTAPADTAVTPDAVQADVVPADAAVTPAAAQNVVQDAKPEAAATAAVSAAALPQTGANWLAVVGSALSGMFLLAAGFVLDRKNRRMN